MLIGYDASRAFGWQNTGTENYSLNLLKAISKLDKKNRYIVFIRPIGGKIPKTIKLPENFRYKVVKPTRLWTQFGLALETWKSPVDLIFVPAHTLPILRKRKFGFSNFHFTFSNFSKAVVTIHDLGVEYLPNYHKFPQRYYLDLASKYAARHADGLIAVSGATKADLVKRYHVSPKKIYRVYEGVEEGFFKPQPKFKIEGVKRKYKISGKYFLYLGTVQPRKNLLMLIDIYSTFVKDFSVKNNISNINKAAPGEIPSLVIAGKLGWNYQGIIDAPKKFGIEKYVKFIGYVKKDYLPSIYSGAIAFLFPSLFEGFGLPILEALGCGCPVIASDIGPHREIQKIIGKNRILDKVEAMVLAKPNSRPQWANLLSQTISNYNNAKRQSLLPKNTFSWKNAALETLAVFREILG